MNTEKLQINLPEGQNELIIREGKAPDLLPIKAPVKVAIIGTIDAPVEFLKRRFEHAVNAAFGDVNELHKHFDHTRCHVLVNREDVSITLVFDEHDEYKRGTVNGTLQLNPKFKEFGINSDKDWDPNELGQFLKMNRAFFPDKSRNMQLVSELKNFVAKVDTIIEKQREDKGNFKDNYSGVVTSNLPDTFSIEIPVFKGYQKEVIEIEFYATTSAREVWLRLVSPGANELFETLRDKCIDEQIKEIREIAPNMVIIEQ